MGEIIIKTPEEIEAMRYAGGVLTKTLDKLSEAVRVGISTEELDKIAEAFIRSHEGCTGLRPCTGQPCQDRGLDV